MNLRRDQWERICSEVRLFALEKTCPVACVVNAFHRGVALVELLTCRNNENPRRRRWSILRAAGATIERWCARGLTETKKDEGEGHVAMRTKCATNEVQNWLLKHVFVFGSRILCWDFHIVDCFRAGISSRTLVSKVLFVVVILMF